MAHTKSNQHLHYHKYTLISQFVFQCHYFHSRYTISERFSKHIPTMIFIQILS